MLYLDNDIWLMQPLTAVIEALDRYRFVVTPYITQPVPVDGLRQDERDLLLKGQFNFGILAASKGGPTDDILGWWLDRLRHYGHAEVQKGGVLRSGLGSLLFVVLAAGGLSCADRSSLQTLQIGTCITEGLIFAWRTALFGMICSRLYSCTSPVCPTF